SIMPLITVLVNDEILETNSFLVIIFEKSNIIGIETKQHFLFFLSVLCFFLLILSIFFKGLTTYVQVKFNTMCRHNTAKRLMKGYLNNSYSWFLNHHSAEMGKNILNEVSIFIKGMGSIIDLIAKTLVSTVLIVLILLVDFKLASISFFLIGGVYFVIFKFLKVFTNKLGKQRLKVEGLNFLALIEAFGAIKEVKAGGLEKTFVDRFSSPSYILAKTNFLINFITQLPRLAIESLVFGGIILIVLYLMEDKGSLAASLPTLSIFAFVAYRLIPAMQGIYSSITNIIFAGPGIENIYDNFKNLNLEQDDKEQGILAFEKSLALKNIFYKYPRAPKNTLEDISLSIPSFTTVGFIGVTGSGKTTLVDIILGLLDGYEGKLEVDGKIINKENIRAWQRNIGYVPQQIYLADTSILNNIAFGVNPNDIRKVDVEKVAKVANIHEFVMKELPLKYETIIGERGVRLSGGQRQRIGIARALYHNPKLLIMDESTSALDNLTEQSVISEIYNLRKNITIIIISHRLSTIEKCDKVFLFEKGKLKNQGSYSEIIESMDGFKNKINS
ncbi:ABC transporter ATP-binding protein/permease, partial [Candidatus Pelagibacter bacterium]|nr:ABC transporter ATP-binding protein/permease [Candidatus Pelagibacter bacterium]